MSEGTKSLLKNIGIADSNIRRLMEEENSQPVPIEGTDIEEPSWFSSILSPFRPSIKEPIIDAYAEDDRIKNNKRDGKSITDGESEIIDPKSTIFNRVITE